MFALNSETKEKYRVPFFHDIWENQFLFWAVVIGALSVFPAVYIPGLNTSVFKHKGITWEWAPAIVCVFVFITGVELWKLVKRRTGWFTDEETEGVKKSKTGLGLRQGFFSFARTLTRTKSEALSDEVKEEKNPQMRMKHCSGGLK